VYKVEPGDTGRMYAVKLFRENGGSGHARELAKRQFKAMSTAYAIVGPDRRHLVPRPYAILERHAAVVVEWIPGSDMLELLRRGWRPPTAYARLVAQAGEWLRALHDAGAPTRTALPAERLIHDAESALARCLPIRAARRASRALADVLPIARSAECAETWAHGDFKLANLMVTNGGLVGIDLQLSQRGPAIFDVASFLNDLAVNLRMPGMWRLLKGESLLERSFLDRYGQREAGAPDIDLLFVRLCSLAETWASETGPRVNALKRAVFSRGYASVACHLIDEIGRSERRHGARGHA